LKDLVTKIAAQEVDADDFACLAAIFVAKGLYRTRVPSLPAR